MKKAVLSFEDIKKILHQRYPFLMVDKVLEYKINQSITTIKNVTANEPHFQGHFPERSIMPGALIMEGIAQSAIILFSLSNRFINPKDYLFLFYSVKGKFIKPVYPGDVLFMEIEAVKILSKVAMIKAVAKVDDEIIAKAQLSFSLVSNKNDKLS